MQRLTRTALVMAVLTAAVACGSDSTAPPDTGPTVGTLISVDKSARFQTISGWEATAQAGQNKAFYPLIRDTVLKLAVNDLGITRLRVEIRSGSESDRDYWTEIGQDDESAAYRCVRFATVNDNADPFTINPNGFFFSHIDNTMSSVVMPMRQLVQARGEKLFINLTYVAFVSNLCPGRTYLHNQNPEEYAEFIQATFQHLRSRFNVTPDALELLLEPNQSVWSADQLARAAVAASNRLKGMGVTPRFIAPSFANIGATFPYFDNMLAVSGFRQSVVELSYHRYAGATEAQLRAVAAQGEQLGIRTSMLEHIGSGYEDLHQDLKTANVSSWQQYTLAFTGPDAGGRYYDIDASDPAHPVVRITDRARYLRQYFRYVRPGAVRIAATTADDAFDPVAFVNDDGKYVVVVKAAHGGTVSVRGMPGGRYGVSWATAAGADSTDDVQISSGGTLDAAIPAAGALTIFRR